MQYQILQTNITRIVWQTVRRINNEILGVKRLIYSRADVLNIVDPGCMQDASHIWTM